MNPVAARGFGRAAAAYERSRPGYPRALIRYLQRDFGLGEGRVVVDLAAGTGKFTRELVGTGAHIVAIEPLAEMRREFRRAVPGVEVRSGTAERTGLPRASADVVTVAQAFHWFNGERALREIHRILRPGGALVVVWNVREESTGWRRAVHRLVESYEDRGVPRHRQRKWRSAFHPGNGFAPPRTRYFRHLQWLSPQGLEDRWLSVSFLAVLPAAEQVRFAARLRRVLATHPGSRGRRRLALPYRTLTLSCVRDERDAPRSRSKGR